MSNTHPDVHPTSNVRLLLHVYRKEWNSAIATLESMLEQQPGDRQSRGELACLVARRGDLKRARRLISEAYPELFENELELAATDLYPALMVAVILHATAELQQRDKLLLAMEKRIATLHRSRGFGYGIMDVHIHAMRGDRDLAIAGLREASETGWGWRQPVWAIDYLWDLEGLTQDPEFIALMDELEADIATQRQWFEENKDKPLF